MRSRAAHWYCRAPESLLRKLVVVLGVSAAGLIAAACGVQPPPSAQVLRGPLDHFVIGRDTCVRSYDPQLGIKSWNTPVEFASVVFSNPSAFPIILKSVTLIDPHNLVLHGGALYIMWGAKHPLAVVSAWSQAGQHSPASSEAWSKRLAVTGAVIPPGPQAASPPPSAINRYEIVPDVSAATAAGGWALGEQVQYYADHRSYTLKVMVPFAIGSAKVPAMAGCKLQLSAITAAVDSYGHELRDPDQPAHHATHALHPALGAHPSSRPAPHATHKPAAKASPKPSGTTTGRSRA